MPAWVLWSAAHIYYLIGFRNRITVVLNWVWNYVTFQRGTRLITGLSGSRMEDMSMPPAMEPGTTIAASLSVKQPLAARPAIAPVRRG
jgi:hypothetical protein